MDIKKSKSLYELTLEVQRALQELETHYLENDSDEMPEEIYERLNINQDEMADKLYGYHLASENLKARANVLKEEATRLQYKAKRLIATSDKLKTIAGEAVREYGEPVMVKGNHTGSYRFKNDAISLSLVPTVSFDGDVDELDDDFTRKTFTVKNIEKDLLYKFLNVMKEMKFGDVQPQSSINIAVNKTAIKNHYVANNELPEGATTKTNHSLRVR